MTAHNITRVAQLALLLVTTMSGIQADDELFPSTYRISSDGTKNGIVVADLDADGLNDVIVGACREVLGVSTDIVVYRGQENGLPLGQAEAVYKGRPDSKYCLKGSTNEFRKLAVGDLDGDGLPDLVAGSTITLFLLCLNATVRFSASSETHAGTAAPPKLAASNSLRNDELAAASKAITITSPVAARRAHILRRVHANSTESQRRRDGRRQLGKAWDRFTDLPIILFCGVAVLAATAGFLLFVAVFIVLPFQTCVWISNWHYFREAERDRRTVAAMMLREEAAARKANDKKDETSSVVTTTSIEATTGPVEEDKGKLEETIDVA